jgi:hypothetical protein
MANTTRRESVTFSVPATPDYKHLNITTFAGIQESDNPFITQNNTASSSLNVYVDEFNALTTRPRVQKKYSTTHKNVTKVFDSKNGGLLFKTKNTNQYDIITENGTNLEAFYAQHHEDIYETNNKTYFFPSFSVCDWDNIDDVESINNYEKTYIPIRNVKFPSDFTEEQKKEVVSPEIEDWNLLTNRYKELWFWDFETDVPKMVGSDLLKNDYIKQRELETISNARYYVLPESFYDKSSLIQGDLYDYDILEITTNGIYFRNGDASQELFVFDAPYNQIPEIECSSDGKNIVLCDDVGKLSYSFYGKPFVELTTSVASHNKSEEYTKPFVVSKSGAFLFVIEHERKVITKYGHTGGYGDVVEEYTKLAEITSPQFLSGIKYQKNTNNEKCVALWYYYDDYSYQHEGLWIIPDFSGVDDVYIESDIETRTVQLANEKDILVYKSKNEDYSVYLMTDVFDDEKRNTVKISVSDRKIYDFVFDVDDNKIFCFTSDSALVGHINIDDKKYISYGVSDGLSDGYVKNKSTTYTLKNGKIFKTNYSPIELFEFSFDDLKTPRIEVIKQLKNKDKDYELWLNLHLDLRDNARNPFLFDNKVWLSSRNRVYWSSGPDPTYYKITDYSDIGSSTEDITGFNLYNDSTMLIYKKKNIYVVSPLNTDYGLTYSFSETRNENGNEAPFSPTITPITNFPIHVNDDGVYVMRQTQNVLTDDSTTTLISSNIDRLWKKENDIQNISTINYKYWTLFFKPDDDNKQTRIFVLDNRNNSWFYWEIENLVVNNITNGNKGLLMWDEQGNGYSFETSDIINVYTGRPEYYDLDYKIIKWYWTSQILHLGTLNYNKKLAWTNFVVSDTDVNEDYALNYKYYVYMDKQNVSNQMTTHGTLNYIKSNVLKTRLPRFDFLQIKLYNVDELLQESDNTTISPEQNNKLRLIGLGFKYQLLEAKFK